MCVFFCLISFSLGLCYVAEDVVPVEKFLLLAWLCNALPEKFGVG
jgi:hypothetical protein